MYGANSTGECFGVNWRSYVLIAHIHVYKVVDKELNLVVEV